MCSRYSLTSPPEAVSHLFKCGDRDNFPPRYNIAPTEPVLIVRADAGGKRELMLVRWGLIPSWVKDPREFSTLINARSETAAEKPSFRGPLRHRRCLVPTDGFYEWTGRPGAKQPHLIRKMGGGLFAFAGLWEHWLGADGSELETMAILTTASNADVAHLHDRMPVIIEPEHFDRWLDCKPGTADHIADLLRPLPEGNLETREVSRKLNNPRADGPDLMEPDASTVR
ncbi:MAG: SOS response-associated peptidase [Hyphomicrobium sp.]|jgi:putative SOS response-associated peptidase YedK|nr:SOS response-associated peptidase [Hyphomicrobium sp.]